MWWAVFPLNFHIEHPSWNFSTSATVGNEVGSKWITTDILYSLVLGKCNQFLQLRDQTSGKVDQVLIDGIGYHPQMFLTNKKWDLPVGRLPSHPFSGTGSRGGGDAFVTTTSSNAPPTPLVTLTVRTPYNVSIKITSIWQRSYRALLLRDCNWWPLAYARHDCTFWPLRRLLLVSLHYIYLYSTATIHYEITLVVLSHVNMFCSDIHVDCKLSSPPASLI